MNAAARVCRGLQDTFSTEVKGTEAVAPTTKELEAVTTPTVAVASPSVAPQASTTVTPSAQVTTNNAQSASSVFSLSNVPWGWVAVIIILVLFATVMYLLFNRPKI